MEYLDDIIRKIDAEQADYSNFLNLPPEFSSPDSSRFVVIPVPFEETTSYGKGAARGPQAVIEASRQVELHDVEISAEPFRAGIYTDTTLLDAPPDGGGLLKAVEQRVAKWLDAGKLPVVVGGEHTVSVGAIRAAAGGGGLTVAQLDAHADLRESYGGAPLSHACAMRRALEGGANRLVQVGIRSMCPEEIRFVEESGAARTFLAKDLLSGKAARKEVLDAIGGKVYLTIDMDVFDPSEAPGVGTPEPGGLRWADVTGLIAGIVERAEIVGFDVVELAPVPGMVVTEFLAAKLIYRIMGLIKLSTDKHSAAGRPQQIRSS